MSQDIERLHPTLNDKPTEQEELDPAAACCGGFSGELRIYGALKDQIIPIELARSVADSVPGSKLIELDCGHNAWPKMKNLELY